MHWKRWITSLVALPLLLLLLLKGGPVLFALLIIAVSAVTLWEYFRIVFHPHQPPVPAVFSILAYTIGALMILAVYHGIWQGIPGLLALNLVGVAVFSIFRFTGNTDAPLVAVKQAFGVVYIPLLLSFLVQLRNGADGILWVSFLLWIVAAGDVGAFYVGSYLGRHKLCPAVSPKKTIEGAAGGLASNVISAWLFKWIFFNAVDGWACIVFALAVGAAGQIGDLFESVFKRAVGIKDSGGLLPGHGGFLDRIDALLLAAPVGYLLKEYLLP